jgi:hypothetical protein
MAEAGLDTRRARQSRLQLEVTMPLKRMKGGGYMLVRPTAAERTAFMEDYKPVALSARAQQALSRGQSVRLEVEQAGDQAPQAPEDH